MKFFLTVNYRWMPGSFAVSLLAVTLPVSAETNYLFPSDIIDQTEQTQYETGRTDRYATQRNWAYPEVSKSSGKKPSYSEHYTGHDAQSAFEDKNRPRHHPEDARMKWFEDSAHYKYDNFKPAQTNKQYQQPYRNKQTYNSAQSYPGEQLPENAYYSDRKNNRQFEARNYRSVRQNAPLNYTQNSSNNRGNEQDRYSRPYPNLLYPSDMEAPKNSDRRKAYSMNSFSSNGYNRGSSPMRRAQNMQIQYVPVPVYSVPGTLPGTVPGVVTPGNMVPGYSHLSPVYNYALPGTSMLNRNRLNNNAFGNLMGTPYSPMTGMGVLPGVTNPFDSFYKIYDNDSRHNRSFTTPETMVPGFSMPDMFSTH